MPIVPVFLNLFGQPQAHRYSLAVELVLRLEAQGVRARLIVPEAGTWDPTEGPTPTQQRALAQSLLDPLGESTTAQVLVAPDPILASYAQAPWQFADQADQIDPLLALHHRWPSLNRIVSRPLGQGDRDRLTGHLTDVARNRLAMDAQMEQALGHLGIPVTPYLHQGPASLENLLHDLQVFQASLISKAA